MVLTNNLDEKWGKNAWSLLHRISNNINDSNIKDFDNFISFFEETLPCPICKHHFSNTINVIPLKSITLNKNTPLVWSYNVHNFVNRELNKKQINLSEIENCKNKWNDNNIIEYLKILNILLVNNNSSLNDILIYYKFLNYIKKILNSKDINIYIDNNINTIHSKYF
jgi:hypothetical protein